MSKLITFLHRETGKAFLQGRRWAEQVQHHKELKAHQLSWSTHFSSLKMSLVCYSCLRSASAEPSLSPFNSIKWTPTSRLETQKQTTCIYICRDSSSIPRRRECTTAYTWSTRGSDAFFQQVMMREMRWDGKRSWYDGYGSLSEWFSSYDSYVLFSFYYDGKTFVLHLIIIRGSPNLVKI